MWDNESGFDWRLFWQIVIMVLTVALFVAGIALLILAGITHRGMVIAEYNAQIAEYGVYKEDLHLLLMQGEFIKYTLFTAFGSLGIIAGAVGFVLDFLWIENY